MGRNRIYWLCQVGGWGGLLAVDLFFVWQMEGLRWQAVVFVGSVCLAGLVSTHLARLWIRAHGWVNLGIRPLLPRVLGISLLVAAGMVAVNAGLAQFLPREGAREEMPAAAYLGFLLFWSFIVMGWMVIYFGAHYFEDRERARAEKWQLEAAVTEAELKALKSQLDPHFMFNCLNSIRALIVDDPPAAQRMVTQLATLLRYTLKTGDATTVPLGQELECVRTYLGLESIRLEERLRYRIEAAEATLEMPVPPMVVQTLVENGIKHGVSASPEGGEIVVQTHLSDGLLHVHVTNTGQLRESGRGSGVGLKNAMERIRLLYGDQASLNLVARAENTVRADLEVPLVPPSEPRAPRAGTAAVDRDPSVADSPAEVS